MSYVNPKTGKWTVIGITSYGIGCGNPKYPGVSIKVSEYLPWIKGVIQAN